MGDLNISREEQDALESVDLGKLDRLIEQSIENRAASGLRALALERCGAYVATEQRRFETALAAFAAAKAPKKLSDTGDDARHAGSSLASAVRQMKHRLEQEKLERQRFHIDDQITPPYGFSEHLSVTVSYRWKSTIDSEWTYSSITFTHDVELTRDYTRSLPKRKPSAAKQERDRQEKLSRTWEHLKQTALYSVRDFFRSGGDAASIPKTYQAKTDSYTRGLNNYSARFWSEKS